MRRRLRAAVAILLALASPAPADAEDPLCAAFLEADGLDLPGLSEPECTRSPHAQIILEITYTVPPDRVSETHKLLQQRYGVGDLRFICCYYGTGGNHAPYPLARPDLFDGFLGSGAVVAASIDIRAPAEGGDLSTFPEPLGALDGLVTISVAGV